MSLQIHDCPGVQVEEVLHNLTRLMPPGPIRAVRAVFVGGGVVRGLAPQFLITRCPNLSSLHLAQVQMDVTQMCSFQGSNFSVCPQLRILRLWYPKVLPVFSALAQTIQKHIRSFPNLNRLCIMGYDPDMFCSLYWTVIPQFIGSQLTHLFLPAFEHVNWFASQQGWLHLCPKNIKYTRLETLTVPWGFRIDTAPLLMAAAPMLQRLCVHSIHPDTPAASLQALTRLTSLVVTQLHVASLPKFPPNFPLISRLSLTSSQASLVLPSGVGARADLAKTVEAVEAVKAVGLCITSKSVEFIGGKGAGKPATSDVLRAALHILPKMQVDKVILSNIALLSWEALTALYGRFTIKKAEIRGWTGSIGRVCVRVPAVEGHQRVQDTASIIFTCFHSDLWH